MDEFNIDLDALRKTIYNEIGIHTFCCALDDQSVKKDTEEILRIFIRHGADIETAIKILLELMEYFGKNHPPEPKLK